MSQITIKCKKCGTQILFDTEATSVTCLHCGTTFLISDLLDENDKFLIDKTNEKEISRMIDFKESLKFGDSTLYQASYEKSEAFFKKAIELEPNNYKGYFGVVKAKTHNFNIFPDEEIDEYCKKSLNLAQGDDYTFVRGELLKLEALKQEKKRKIILKNEQAKLARKNLKKQKFKHFLLFFSITIISLATIAYFVYPVLKNKNKEEDVILRISTAEQFKNIYKNKNYLKASIYLENDIDFENQQITSYGTETQPFIGTFNGQNHTISNLIIEKNSNSNHIGLFGFCKDANISNTTFTNVNIAESLNSSSDLFVGLISGYCLNTKIENCKIESTSKINLVESNQRNFSVGSISGFAINSKISNCYSKSQIVANSTNSSTTNLFCAGGFLGKMQSTTIKNSYSSSSISILTANNYSQINISGISGIIVEDTTYSIIENSFFNGEINCQSGPINDNIIISGFVPNTSNIILLNNAVSFNSQNFKHNSNELSIQNLVDYNYECIEFLTSNFENYIQTNLSENIYCK